MPIRKIHCAACLHCKFVRHSEDNGKTYIYQVRCAKKQWRTRTGTEARYHACMLRHRVLDACEYYEPSGDEGDIEQFLRDLYDSLPRTRIIYQGEDDETLS